jgi:hypothetical protein
VRRSAISFVISLALTSACSVREATFTLVEFGAVPIVYTDTTGHVVEDLVADGATEIGPAISWGAHKFSDGVSLATNKVVDGVNRGVDRMERALKPDEPLERINEPLPKITLWKPPAPTDAEIDASASATISRGTVALPPPKQSVRTARPRGQTFHPDLSPAARGVEDRYLECCGGS